MWTVLALSSPVHAQSAAADEGLSTFVAEGAVGPWVAGLNVTVRDHRTVVASHYYYASRGIDIPLTVDAIHETILWDEPGGGRFTLHLTNDDAREPRPLTFYTSTGLAGTWTREGKSLPVTFGFGTVRDGSSPARWYGDVTSESDAVFEARVRSFLTGVRSGNRHQVAGAVSYPVTVNMGRTTIIRSRADLLARWSAIFTPTYVAQLRKGIPHEMFVRNGMAMVAGGAVWFDAKGAKVLNLP